MVKLVSRRDALGCLAGAAATPWAASIAVAQDGPLFATVDEAEAALFVLEKFLNGAATIGEIARLYADKVSYFDKGELTRAQILDIRRTFLSRWSTRTYKPDLKTLVVRRDGDKKFVVKVEVDFEVQNVAAKVAGRSLVDLTIRRRRDSFEVVREAGRVIVQK